jgi:hypothetical protein
MDESAKTEPDAGGTAPAGGEAGGAPAPEAGASVWKVGAESGPTWLAQLQGMIDNIATQAGPVVREVAAKAAELAAVAADHAGPIAQRAAAVTRDVSVKVAERSRQVAADLRHATDQEQAGDRPAANAAPPDIQEAPEP